MDVYASQKIKATVKSIGSLILIVFYSSLIDFYYIGPNIHNILSELKFLVKSKSVTAKLVHKIFIDVNTMLFDTMAFFNGFNRAVIKDVKKHLSGDAIFNERLFINLRGAINSNEIMTICRDYTGSQRYNELISTKIKPKVKSDVKVREPKKYGDEVKLEKNDGALIKFLSFKRATKRKLFLGKEMNIKDYIEYKDDYLKSVQKLKNLEDDIGNTIEKRDSKIIEVFDFINNVTNTDKDNEVKIKGLSFWDEADENKDKENKKENIESQLTFGFDFDFEESEQNKKKDKKEEKKDDNKNIQNVFDFINNQSNSNNKDNKVDNKKKDIGFEKDSNKNDIKPNIKNETNNQAKKNENNNDNKKDSNNKNAPQLFNFDTFKNNKNNNTNNQNINNKNNNNDNNNNNQVMNFFDFGKANDNKNNNTFDFNKMQNTQKVENKQNNNNNLNNNTNNNAFNFDNFKMPNNNNNTNTNTNTNTNKNLNNNNAFMGTNNMNNFNNQSNQNNQNKSNNQMNFQNNQPSNTTTNNNNSNKNNDNLTNLLASFNFPNSNNNTTSMSQYIPSFPANNNNNNNNNNFNFNFNQQNNNNVFNQNNLALFSSQAPGKNDGFNFSNFGNNMMVPFQKEPEIFVDLKEQVCFYYNFTSGNKIVNAISKGYLGLTTESDKIKNKDFNIEFKTEKFKDQQYIQKDFDSKMNKINDLSYKIHFDNLNKSEKLLNYMINPNILAQNRILEPMIGGENNILRYKFMYNNNVKKDILKLELNILYKTVIQNGNMIKSDGNITTNNNNQIIVEYNSKINEGKIEFPLNVNVFALVGKITIIVHLKEDVISEMKVEIKDNNQKILKAKTETQISYEFS